MLEFLRDILWFKPGELGEIIRKIRAPKYQYEANWESTVLMALTFGTVFAFVGNTWGGIVYLWWAKIALQALNQKRFFEPRDPPAP